MTYEARQLDSPLWLIKIRVRDIHVRSDKIEMNLNLYHQASKVVPTVSHPSHSQLRS